jgi:proteasome lid subunit RPN8/RPN11
MTWKIKKEVLASILEFSKASYPNEFSGLLIGEENLITDIYILPATQNYAHSSVLRLDLAPLSTSIIGSVHSHPIRSGKPSSADLKFFSSKKINIISYYPFDFSSFSVYDSFGKEVFLEVF